MNYVYNDGGRSAAGYRGEAGDCVTRAIAIATGKPYREVYDAIFDGIRQHAVGRSCSAKRAARGRGRSGTTPRNGVSPKVWRPYLESIGWKWTPTMQIGQGCRVHLRADELPSGRLVVAVSNHYVAVIDGVIHDTYDSRGGGRVHVKGYWRAAS